MNTAIAEKWFWIFLSSMKISKQTLKNLKRSKAMKKLVLMCGILVSVANAEMAGGSVGESILECFVSSNEQACKSLIDSGFIGEAYECDKRGMCFIGGSANQIIGNKDKAIPYLEKLVSLNDSQRKQDFMFITMTSLGINEKDALEVQEGAYIDLLQYYASNQMPEKLGTYATFACRQTTNKQTLSYACGILAPLFYKADEYHDAFAYAKKGCETNVKRDEAYDANISRVNCLGVGLLYEGGKGVRQDYAKAVEYYKKGCDLGYDAPCLALAKMYMEGKGVPRNRSSAKRLFGKACDLGEQVACDEYRELNQAGVQ